MASPGLKRLIKKLGMIDSVELQENILEALLFQLEIFR